MSRKLRVLGLKNALIMGVPALAACVVLAGVISLLTQRGLDYSFGLSLDILFTLTVVWFFSSWFRGRLGAGSVLLDAGQHPRWWLFLLVTVMSVSTGGLTDFLEPRPLRTDATSPFFDLLRILFIGSLMFGRLQICEGGLWIYWSLTRWEEISAYSWKDETTLVLERKDGFSFFRSGFVVPPQHRTAFEEHLLQHVKQDASND